MGKSSENNLVNDVVIAIRVSPNNYRRELVKRIFVDAFTFEVARAVDGNSSERIIDDFSGKKEKQRLIAIILALKDSGLVTSDDDGRTTSICFGSEAKQLCGDVSDERLWELVRHTICFRLTKSEMLRSIELSKQYRATLDTEAVKDNWRKVGSIIDLILMGDLRLMGPEFESGLIVEDLTQPTADAKRFVWYSLGDKTSKTLLIVDLAEPQIIKGYHRFRIKSAVSALECGRDFVIFHGISTSL